MKFRFGREESWGIWGAEEQQEQQEQQEQGGNYELQITFSLFPFPSKLRITNYELRINKTTGSNRHLTRHWLTAKLLVNRQISVETRPS